MDSGRGTEMLSIGRRLLERRKTPRYLMSQNAKILFRDRSCQMTCAVLEISRSGARLRPADAVLLPNEFELVLSRNSKVTCEAVHRTETEIGVRFLSRL